jgi:hypothetical protein
VSGHSVSSSLVDDAEIFTDRLELARRSTSDQGDGVALLLLGLEASRVTLIPGVFLLYVMLPVKKEAL